jgi:hypothetical protein
MNLVSPARKLKPQFGGDNSAAAVGWITGDANLHAPPTISSLDSQEWLGMQEREVKNALVAWSLSGSEGRAGTPGSPPANLDRQQ